MYRRERKKLESRIGEKHANKTMTLTQIELSSECGLKLVEAKANAAFVNFKLISGVKQ